MTPNNQRILFWIGAIALIHGLIWSVDYGQTALGESPALDNRQTLLLAQQMAAGDLPAEPFHRAPLYPYLLSLFLSAGLPFESLAVAARGLNVLAFAATAVAAAYAAHAVWRRRSAAWIAGLLIALNPVLLFFVGDAFDILPATACFALAFALVPGWLRQKRVGCTFKIAALLSLGAALRSHLLPLALLWCPLACLLGGKRKPLHLAAAVPPLALSFLLLGLANLKVAGEFRTMPWQGAYNLWAGNRPDAPGRIYAQQIRVDFEDTYDNPAKLESIALYERQTGESPPHSIDAVNAYWKGKFFDHVAENPVQWLGLMARKAYYFLNSYEQYDNKTYGFHKRRHPLLRWNPVHWGALLLLAVAGTLTGLRDPAQRAFLFTAIGTFAVYAAGTILFYTSNRFRLPMLPLLACLGGGIVLLPAAWRAARARWRAGLLGCLGLTAAIAYTGFFNARATDTWEEDYALLANAALRTGRDADALQWANRALEANPRRNDMWPVLAQARFNRWALNENAGPLDRATAETFLQEARNAAETDADFAAISGIYLWKLNRRDKAQAVWEKHASDDPLARLCLFWTDLQPVPSPSDLESYRGHERFDLLRAAVVAKRAPSKNPLLAKTFARIFSPADAPNESNSAKP